MKGKMSRRPKRHWNKKTDASAETPELQQETGETAVGSDAADVPSALPVIAIVGRPNVGKSSLFNAILKKRQAIVHFDSGVTRDRVSATGVYNSRRFTLIDTGGLGMYSGEKKGVGFWDKLIEQQVDAAIESAEAILFVVDAQAGMSPLDSGIAAKLRACEKKIILVANKADNREDELHADEFHRLGFDRIYPVSCLHRKGISEIMDSALADVPALPESKMKKHPLRIAVLGRPNVGKSSLVNRLLGEDRVIVSDVPGTTRDAIDIEFTLHCKDETVPALLVDTAGLRKKSKIDEAVEHYSMMRAEEALNSCDIVLFVIESTNYAATSQDKTIARMIEDSGKGCILVANKWDIRFDNMKKKELEEEIRSSLPQMKYAPLVFTSALNGYNFGEIFEIIAELRAQMGLKISTAMLNRVIGDATERNLPPVVGLKPLKIYYGTMTGNCPPRFTLFVNKAEYCSDIYKIYLSNYFRKAFDLIGFPIRIILRERERRDLSEVSNHLGSKHKKPTDAKSAKAEKEKLRRQRAIAKRPPRRDSDND